MAQGGFIISLDFELHWGVRDVVNIRDKKDYFLRARAAIPEILRAFEEHGVHATWATVGFLFAKDKRHLSAHLPGVRPLYARSEFDPYPFLNEIGDGERSDPFHYAPSLLQAIAETAGQEIASHTFSHYYCLEDGQTGHAFEADLQAAASIGEPFGSVVENLVFPRGQHNPAYDSVLKRCGVRSYRVPPEFQPYQPRRVGEETLTRRGLRLLDSYVPLGGSYAAERSVDEHGAVPLRAGLFFRPYSSSRRRLEPLRMRRLFAAMRDAAERQRDFHLWWHPHNFGTHTDENLAMLRKVLGEYRTLRERYAWPSWSMGEAARSMGEAA